MTPQAPIAASDTTNPYVFSAQAQAEPQYQPQPSASVRTTTGPSAQAKTKSSGLSGLTVWIIVAAVVVIAGLALWFLLFNNGDAKKFVGTWTPVTSVGGASAGLVADGSRLVVSRADGKLTVTAVDGKGQSIGPLKASLKRGKLEFGLEYAGSDQQGQLKTQLVKAVMGVVLKDFRATLSTGPAGTVYLSYSGTATNDLVKGTTNAVQLHRVSAQ